MNEYRYWTVEQIMEEISLSSWEHRAMHPDLIKEIERRLNFAFDNGVMEG